MEPSTISERVLKDSRSRPSTSALSSPAGGMTAPLYFSIIDTDLLRRFPRSLARSPFILASRALVEKSPSRPKGTSRSRNYLNWSTPALSAVSTGSTTLPFDLLIFSPSTVHQPWAKTFFGGSRPADQRKAGQYTAWHRNMSFSIICTSAGPYFFPLLKYTSTLTFFL